jgi:hypothetical protein
VSALEERTASETACPRCGTGLATDQEWCLECGTAITTRIRPAPDWRVPVAIVGGIAALVALGLLFALVSLSNTANQSVSTVTVAAAPAPSATPKAPATPPAATTPKPATTANAPAAATIASWRAGVTGYTVVVDVIPAKAAAKARATAVAAAGIPVGLLYSSDYSSMRPGDWIVFSGTYTTRAQADAAATRLQAKGEPGAYAFSVVPAH